MNRKYNHFSGSTHSFGFFSSNSDTYLMPWTENCWLCGVLSRNRRDTESANAARARGQKRSWGEKKSGGAEPQIPGGGGSAFRASRSRERAARTRRGMPGAAPRAGLRNPRSYPKPIQGLGAGKRPQQPGVGDSVKLSKKKDKIL